MLKCWRDNNDSFENSDALIYPLNTKVYDLDQNIENIIIGIAIPQYSLHTFEMPKVFQFWSLSSNSYLQQDNLIF